MDRFSDECELFARKVDELIIDKKYDELKKYILQIEGYVEIHDALEYAPIFYYLGTAKGVLADQRLKNNNCKIDDEYLNLRKESFYYLRKSIEMIEKVDEKHPLLLSAYTNYANGLDTCGRVIEAIRVYKKAINISEKFGMAYGNYGRALKFYANMVNDSGHRNELHFYAYHAIQHSLEIKDPNMHEEAILYFTKIIDGYEKVLPKEQWMEPIQFEQFDLGEQEEKNYRIWCLKNHLFLNPLNDVMQEETAFAHDPLTITSFTEYVDSDEDKENINPPKWFAMLNQLKQEYICARYLCYKGSQKDKEPHYADKEVKLSLSSYEYVNYSIRLEHLKLSFRSLFSIFDKIAFEINEFWNLGLGERDASAAKVFNSNKYPMENIALAALYWGNCEFREKFGNAEEPSEKDLSVLRNAFEHKFVKVHEYPYEEKLKIKDDSFYHVDENTLEELTIRLLQLTREWIMELVYAIGIEEGKKKTDGNAIRLNIRDYDDEWKF